MASFEIAYQRVARAEGGYQNNPNDTGNYNSRRELVGTNWGINAMIYEDWIGRPPSEQDMRDMSKATAKLIYEQRYWKPIMGDLIYEQPLADIIFDGRVNHGPTGVKLLQEVLGIKQDFIFGPQTLNAVNNAIPAILYHDYKQRRIRFYNWLVQRTPSFKGFLNGWLIRINSFNDYPEPSGPIVDNTSTVTDKKKGSNILLAAAFLFTIYKISSNEN